MEDNFAQSGRPVGSGTGDAPAGGAATGGPAGVDSPWVQTSRSPGDGHPAGRARSLLHSAKEQAASQLNAQKNRATDQLDQIAGQVRRSTQRLREERHDIVAVALERAVDGLERVSAQLRARDVDDLLADLERFGRQRPALFIGSSFAAGIVLARFAKASNTSSSSSRHARREPGGRTSTSFNRPGPADAIGRESQ
jgi:hypothetical protein